MLCLALAVVWMTTLPAEPWVDQANGMIWAVFVADYSFHLWRSPNRGSFVRGNVPDLLAILPIDFLVEFLLQGNLAGYGRLFRLFRLFRAAAFLWRGWRNIHAILRISGLGYVLMVTCGLIVVGGVGIWLVEPDVGSVGDGLWWSVVTAATVGYGDISPKTPWGRLLAGLLMVVGIGTISMATSAITAHLLGKQRTTNPFVEDLISELEGWDEMTPEHRRQLAALLKTLSEEETERA